MAAAKVDSKLIGFAIGGAQSANSGDSEALSLTGDWSIAVSYTHLDVYKRQPRTTLFPYTTLFRSFTYNMAAAKVDSKLIGFAIGGAQSANSGEDVYKRQQRNLYSSHT